MYSGADGEARQQNGAGDRHVPRARERGEWFLAEEIPGTRTGIAHAIRVQRQDRDEHEAKTPGLDVSLGFLIKIPPAVQRCPNPVHRH
jgi:hypothetical protein